MNNQRKKKDKKAEHKAYKASKDLFAARASTGRNYAREMGRKWNKSATYGVSSFHRKLGWVGRPDLEGKDPLYLQGLEYQTIDFHSNSDKLAYRNPFIASSIQIGRYLGYQIAKVKINQVEVLEEELLGIDSMIENGTMLPRATLIELKRRRDITAANLKAAEKKADPIILEDVYFHIYQSTMLEVIDPDTPYGALRMKQSRVGRNLDYIDQTISQRNVEFCVPCRETNRRDRQECKRKGHEEPLYWIGSAPVFLKLSNSSETRSFQERFDQDQIDPEDLSNMEVDRIFELLLLLAEWVAWPEKSAEHRHAKARHYQRELDKLKLQLAPSQNEVKRIDLLIDQVRLREDSILDSETDCLRRITNLDRDYLTLEQKIETQRTDLLKINRDLTEERMQLMREAILCVTAKTSPSPLVENRILEIQKSINESLPQILTLEKKLLKARTEYHSNREAIDRQLASVDRSRNNSEVEIRRLLEEKAKIVTQQEPILEEIRITTCYLNEYGGSIC